MGSGVASRRMIDSAQGIDTTLIPRGPGPVMDTPGRAAGWYGAAAARTASAAAPRRGETAAVEPAQRPALTTPAFTGKGALNTGSAPDPALVQASWPVLCPLSAEAGAKVAATSRCAPAISTSACPGK